jgi:hypothetical protein
MNMKGIDMDEPAVNDDKKTQMEARPPAFIWGMTVELGDDAAWEALGKKEWPVQQLPVDSPPDAPVRPVLAEWVEQGARDPRPQLVRVPIRCKDAHARLTCKEQWPVQPGEFVVLKRWFRRTRKAAVMSMSATDTGFVYRLATMNRERQIVVPGRWDRLYRYSKI